MQIIWARLKRRDGPKRHVEISTPRCPERVIYSTSKWRERFPRNPNRVPQEEARYYIWITCVCVCAGCVCVCVGGGSVTRSLFCE